MWRPTQRFVVAMVVLAVIVGVVCFVHHGPVREGSRYFGAQHTFLTALVTNIGLTGLALAALADLLRLLWWGGGLVRGQPHRATLRLTSRFAQTVAEVCLRESEALRVELRCKEANVGIVAFRVWLGSTGTPDGNTPGEAKSGDLAWQAEKAWTGVVYPGPPRSKGRLLVRLDGNTESWARLEVRCRATLSLMALQRARGAQNEWHV